MTKRILVAVDFSEASTEALRGARALARARSMELGVVHVVPIVVDMQPLFPQNYGPNLTASPELWATARQAAEDRLRQLLEGDAATLFVESGEPYAEIVRRAEAWPADLVVIGSHGRTGLARVLIGSVAERVARYAHCPVLIARAGGGNKVVLAATDLSEPSLPAVAAGAEEARLRGCRLIAAHAVDTSLSEYLALPSMPFGAPVAVPSEADRQVERQALLEVLKQSIARFGTTGEPLVLDGTPVASLVRSMDELQPELLVVGTHGRTGLSRVAMGSVAEQLVRLAPCSVLVVRQ